MNSYQCPGILQPSRHLHRKKKKIKIDIVRIYVRLENQLRAAKMKRWKKGKTNAISIVYFLVRHVHIFKS